jgi:hypothetical protein
MERAAEIVIAAVESANLSTILTAIHRGGLGHLTRVLDPKRGDVAGQLRRAGVEVPEGFSLGSDNRVAVMISAAARTPAATELLRRQGAIATWWVPRSAGPAPLVFGSLAGRSRSRRGLPTEALAD